VTSQIIGNWDIHWHIYLARLFGMTGQGVGYAVRRGERIAKENHFTLIDWLGYLFTVVPHMFLIPRV